MHFLKFSSVVLFLATVSVAFPESENKPFKLESFEKSKPWNYLAIENLGHEFRKKENRIELGTKIYHLLKSLLPISSSGNAKVFFNKPVPKNELEKILGPSTHSTKAQHIYFLGTNSSGKHFLNIGFSSNTTTSANIYVEN